MNTEIVTKYQISFQNSIDDSGKIDKFPYTNLGDLSIFLYDWSDDELNELLLPDIEEALADANSEIQNGSETISILIYQDKVVFYPEDVAPFSLPTNDFKEIVEGWRDFLLTPPLKSFCIL